MTAFGTTTTRTLSILASSVLYSSHKFDLPVRTLVTTCDTICERTVSFYHGQCWVTIMHVITGADIFSKEHKVTICKKCWAVLLTFHVYVVTIFLWLLWQFHRDLLIQDWKETSQVGPNYDFRTHKCMICSLVHVGILTQYCHHDIKFMWQKWWQWHDHAPSDTQYCQDFEAPDSLNMWAKSQHRRMWHTRVMDS